jgi:TolB protein
MRKEPLYFTILIALLLGWGPAPLSQDKAIGLFEAQSDIGQVLHPGTATYDSKTRIYHLEGSGYNIWGTHDEFHFLWKKMTGDFILKGDFSFLTSGGVDDKKIGWMLRTSLDSASPHVIGVVHGAGLTSLQFRRTIGAVTEEKKFSLRAADFIQLQRKGNLYIVSVSKGGGPLQTERIDSLNLGKELYAGLFICSHDKNASEKADVSQVSILKSK